MSRTANAWGAAAMAVIAALGCGSSGDKGATPDPSDAGNGGNGGNGGAPPATVTECFGKPLPPRALALPARPTPPSSLAPYSPTTEWRTADPADAGFDPAALQAALSFSTAHSSTQGIVVIRYGYIVGEQYFGGFTEGTRHESFSVAKSFSSALVGIAIDQGLLSGVNERLCEYYPAQWDCNDAADPRSRITLEHVMNVESGLDWEEDWSGTPGRRNDTLTAGPNLVNAVLAKQSVAEPGTVQTYSTGDPSLLTGVIQGATGKTALEYAREVLFGPIGAMGIQWSSDPAGRTTTYANLQATTREFAKLGLLYSHRGLWDGRQVVSQQWVDFSTQAADPCVDQYRYLWHINAPIRLGVPDPNCTELTTCTPATFADLPRDAYFAEGVAGQFVFVFPSQDLVIARVAQDEFNSTYWDEYARGLLEKIFQAIRS